MPSDQSTWLISVPQDGDSEGLVEEITPKLLSQAKFPSKNITSLNIPSFKVGNRRSLALRSSSGV
jgi:V-type H+-transporting ATPase subunit C